jgi:epoxide hydrolase
MSNSKTILPFQINIPKTDLDDLHAQLKHTRWSDEPENAGWSLGVSLEYLKDLGGANVPRGTRTVCG